METFDASLLTVLASYFMVDDLILFRSINKQLWNLLGKEDSPIDAPVWKSMFYNEYYQEEYADISR